MKTCFAYIRVSTVKQGVHGVSLAEQRDAIAQYAARNNITITRWFEERVTAAKRGRPVFSEMLKGLEAGEATGLIVHKIDRSARNLRDWADLGQLIDRGIYVHFVTDNLDMASRGGRLSADIQAVVAADYVRNLREETRKGFYGRLKQGLYPLPAPLGYLNCGKGKPKSPDPATAPLIQYAFEQYASGRHTLKTLQAELMTKGLRSRRAKMLSVSSISDILNNPFYHGQIRIERTNELFDGAHEPLISRMLFDRVQDALQGRTQRRVQKHTFTFARLITCQSCDHSLTGELQKGYIYYRCHTATCPATSLREEHIDQSFRTTFGALQLSPEFKLYLKAEAAAQRNNWRTFEEHRHQQIGMKLRAIKDRLDRLTDAYLDNMIEKPVFEERRLGLLAAQKDITLGEAQRKADPAAAFDRLQEFFELASSLDLSYQLAIGPAKREFVQIVTSNCEARQKNLAIKLQKPFQMLADLQKTAHGGPCRDGPRTVQLLLSGIEEWPVHSLRLPSAITVMKIPT